MKDEECAWHTSTYSGWLSDVIGKIRLGAALGCRVVSEALLVSCRVTASAVVCMVWMEECACWACCLQLERGGPSLSDSHSTVMDMKGLRSVSLYKRAAFHSAVPTWAFCLGRLPSHCEGMKLLRLYKVYDDDIHLPRPLHATSVFLMFTSAILPQLFYIWFLL